MRRRAAHPALVLAALLAAGRPGAAAPPAFVVEGAPGAGGSVEHAAALQWEALERLFAQVAGQPAGGTRRPVVIRAGESPGHGRGGASTPGTVALRLDSGRLDEAAATALRHEVAHQFLFQVCPALADDALAHEAFAVSTSGELARWEANRYLSLPAARAALEREPRADTRESRRALARLLREWSGPDGSDAVAADSLAPALRRRLRACADAARRRRLRRASWRVPGAARGATRWWC